MGERWLTFRETTQNGSLGKQLRAARGLPGALGRLRYRLLVKAVRLGDTKSVVYSTGGSDLVQLVRLASGADRVVELGTYAGWTALTLAAAYPDADIVAIDPMPVENRAIYLRQHSAGARIEVLPVTAEVARGARLDVDLVFIDVTHDEPTTRIAFEAWEEAVRPGGTVCFHDIHLPGVAQAVENLGLIGERLGESMFVWRK